MPVFTSGYQTRLDVWLSPDQKLKFQKICNKRRIGMSALLRDYVERIIRKGT